MMRWSPAQRTRPGCPHRRLLFLLRQQLPDGLAPGASTFRPWASANFVGARHIFPCILAAGDRAALCCALQERLGAAEWALPGHIVADVTVEGGAGRDQIRIEILTVED